MSKRTFTVYLEVGEVFPLGRVNKDIMVCQERNNKKQNEWTQIDASRKEDRPQFKLKCYRTIKVQKVNQGLII